MGDKTEIAWCDSTFNPWIGCTKVGPGCDHCYAERDFDHRFNKVKWGPGNPRLKTTKKNWMNPVKWDKKGFWECPDCGWRGEENNNSTMRLYPENGLLCESCNAVCQPARRRVFCASLADVFDNEVDPLWRMALSWWPLDWVVAGGESGPNARPMQSEWARQIRNQCNDAGIPFLFKQWGEWAPYDRGKTDSEVLIVPGSMDGPLGKFGKKLSGRSLDGTTWDQFPEISR